MMDYFVNNLRLAELDIRDIKKVLIKQKKTNLRFAISTLCFSVIVLGLDKRISMLNKEIKELKERKEN